MLASSRPSADKALSLLKKEQLLIKMVSCTWDNVDQSLCYFVPQLVNPQKERPINRYVSQNANRQNIWNTATGTWQTRSIQGQRGSQKNTAYTKKTSTTLLPHDGVMTLYTVKHGLGFAFSLHDVYLKLGDDKALDLRTARHVNDTELALSHYKYVFLQNGTTDYRWWIENNEHGQEYNKIRSVTIDEIRKYNRECFKKNIIPSHNEIMACLRQKALQAIIIYDNFGDKKTRLNAIRVSQFVSSQLGWQTALPILFIHPKNCPFRSYSIEEQLEDISITQMGSQDALAQQFASSLLLIPEIKSKKLSYDLLSLVINKDFEEAEAFILRNPGLDLSLCDRNGYTSLHLAVINDQPDLVRLILSQDKNIFQSNSFNQRTPLSIAIYNQNENLTKMLLRYGTATRGKLGHVFLHLIKDDLIAQALFFLKICFQMDIKISMDLKTDDGRTPLLHAVIQYNNKLDVEKINQYKELIQQILLQGADPYAQTTEKRNAFDIVIYNRNFSLLNILTTYLQYDYFLDVGYTLITATHANNLYEAAEFFIREKQLDLLFSILERFQLWIWFSPSKLSLLLRKIVYSNNDKFIQQLCRLGANPLEKIGGTTCFEDLLNERNYQKIWFIYENIYKKDLLKLMGHDLLVFFAHAKKWHEVNRLLQDDARLSKAEGLDSLFLDIHELFLFRDLENNVDEQTLLHAFFNFQQLGDEEKVHTIIRLVLQGWYINTNEVYIESGETPLHIAFRKSNKAFIFSLLRTNVNLTAVNAHGEALFIKVLEFLEKEIYEATQYDLRFHIDPLKQILFFLALKQKYHLIKILIKANSLLTFTHLAATFSVLMFSDTVNYPLAKLMLATNINQLSLQKLEIIIGKLLRDNKLDQINFIVERVGAIKIDIENPENGDTLLHAGIISNHMALVKTICQRIPNLNKKNKADETAITLATKKTNNQMLCHIVKHTPLSKVGVEELTQLINTFLTDTLNKKENPINDEEVFYSFKEVIDPVLCHIGKRNISEIGKILFSLMKNNHIEVAQTILVDLKKNETRCLLALYWMFKNAKKTDDVFEIIRLIPPEIGFLQKSANRNILQKIEKNAILRICLEEKRMHNGNASEQRNDKEVCSFLSLQRSFFRNPLTLFSTQSITIFNSIAKDKCELAQKKLAIEELKVSKLLKLDF